MEIRNKHIQTFTEGEKEVRRIFSGEIILTGNEMLSYPQYWRGHMCPLINEIAADVLGITRRTQFTVKPDVLYKSVATLFDEIATEGLESRTLEVFLQHNPNLRAKMVEAGIVLASTGLVHRFALMNYFSHSEVIANFAFVTW